MDANIIFFIDRFWPYKARSQSSIASRRLGQTGRKWIIWAVKIAAFTFFSSITSAIAKLSNPPQLLYTDIVSGPNEGGENNKGAYLSLFGRHFGDTGVGTRVKVFINDIEVDNYRYLGPANSIPNLQKITVQIGSLGNPVMGLRLPIKVVVDGLSSNTNHYFIVNPGTIYFLSLKGSDFRGDGSFMNPFRTLQTANIKLNRSQGCPVTEGNQPITVAGVWGLLKPGDIVVMRGGTWTDVAIDGFFLRVQNKSGSVPTGMSGTGFITVMGYPGESIFIDRTNTVGDNQSGGGIASADSARQRLGCGAWIAISNLKIESGFNDGSVNTQQGNSNPKGSHWRVVNNELTAKSCQISTKCRAAGIAGNGKDNFWVGNHIHDVYDKPDGVTDFENHGVYIDGDGSYEVAYNRIENIIGGNGIQAHSASGGIINNVNVHHNVIHGVGKHGINLSSGSTENFLIYQNTISTKSA